MLVVGVLVLLGGLRQLGIIPGRTSVAASDPRSRAMVGSWAGSIGNCRSAMTFNADGTYVVHTGAVARWQIEGERLILTGDGSAMTWRLIAWTDNSLTFMLGDPGQRYTMVRCPGSAGAASPSPEAPAPNRSMSVAPPPGLQGRWGVSFPVNGSQYTGEFLGANGSGTLVLEYRDETGPMRISEQCTYSGTSNVAVRCRDPKILSGRNTYSPDNFDLTPDGPGVMRGRISSTNGDSATATFTRR